MKFHDFSPFYRSSEGIKPKVSGDRLLGNPLVADVQSGASFKFDGSNDRVTNTVNSVTSSADVTASAWIKTTKSTGDMMVLGLGNAHSTSGIDWYLRVNEGVFDTLAYRYDGYSVSLASGVSVADGEWHHLVMVITDRVGDSTSYGSKVEFYVDGVLASSVGPGDSNTTGMRNFKSDAASIVGDLWIGSRIDAGSDFFDGEIRQARIHNRALSADEVRAAYSGQAVPYEYAGASQAELVTNGDFSTSSGWDANVRVVLATNTATWSLSGEQYLRRSDWLIEAGKKYRLKVVTSTHTATGSLRIYDYAANNVISPDLTISGTGTHVLEFVAQNSSSSGALIGIVGTSGAYAGVMTDLSCVQIGCVAEYLPTGINSTQWVDTSGNGLHGSTSTATAVNHTIGSLTVESGATIKLQDGAGIDFSATSDATGKTSELLDDYEEGTWTPSLTALSTTGAVGTYIRIGSQVTAWYQLSGITYDGSGTDTVFLSGLPFSRSNISGGVTQNYSPIQTYKFNYVSGIGLYWAWDDDTKVQLYEMVDNGTSSALTEASFPTSSGPSLLGVITYTV